FLVTPTTLHAEQIVHALQVGKHVFCEKPLSLELAECRRVEREAAKRHDLKVMIGYGRRFDPSYRDAYDKIQAGLIGRPFLARSLLGNPTPSRVFAAGTIAIHRGLAEFGDVDNGVATCEFTDGRLACFYASRTMAHGHETLTEIFGTEGRLTVGHNPRLNRVD